MNTAPNAARLGRSGTAVIGFVLIFGFGPADGGGVATPAARADQPFHDHVLLPVHDTWATHDDATVHGAEATFRVGIEPQECAPPVYDPCDAAEACCDGGADYDFCAPSGACAATTPSWSAFRKFRGYVRFDLSEVTAGRVAHAALILRESEVHEARGGPLELAATRLRSIGAGAGICAWDEATLDDTEGSLWSSLPQNLSIAGDGVWTFDVTKAVRDWLTGDTDAAGAPVRDNCGFMLHDPAFGNGSAPIERWVLFNTKEGLGGPRLSVRIAHDLDGDGFAADEDCDEDEDAVFPGAVETCNGVDDDCDGEIDEEDCDGLDNDCDGAWDEAGAAGCVDGTTCVVDACLPSCQDDCSGAFDRGCRRGEDGAWLRLGCADVDADPCLDWYEAGACNFGEHCSFGSCSFNCVDDCDDAGARRCEGPSPGVAAVATCADHDDDGCLEWGGFVTCARGQTCMDAACIGVACAAVCALGERRCTTLGDGSPAFETCWTWNEAGGGDDADCLVWGGRSGCPAGASCWGDGVCALEAPGPEPTPDAVEAPADAGGSDGASGDVSSEVGPEVAAEPVPDGGGEGDSTSVDVPDAAVSDGVGPDGARPDVGGDDGTGAGDGTASDDDPETGPTADVSLPDAGSEVGSDDERGLGPDMDGGLSAGGADEGCDCHASPGSRALPAWLVAVVLLTMRRRRRRRR